MGRLLVFRGQALDREIELVRLPFSIGRAPTNDLVLEDPVRSVSREHAEIRAEGGRYVLVDCQSENGIWVSGNRRATIPFDAETIASIGPFRLKIEGAPTPEETLVERTITPGVKESQPTQTSKPTLPSQPRTARLWSAGVLAQMARANKKWVIGSGLAVVILPVAIIGSFYWRSARRSEQAQRQLQGWIQTATAQIGSGACAEALSQNIAPGLAQFPQNTDLQSLKQRADECSRSRPPQPPPVDRPTVEQLATIREMLGNNQCDAARKSLTDLLDRQPDNPDAQILKSDVDACAPLPVMTVVTPRPRPAVAVAQQVAAEEGGLEVLQGETDRDYQGRMKAMRERYDNAVALAAKGPSREAIGLFEGIARDATPRYLDVNTRLANARRAYRATAQRLLADARSLAASEKWNEALDKYKQALDVDSSLSIDGEVRKVNADKLQAGHSLCTTAKQAQSYTPAEAPALYRRVLELLPPDDACSIQARQFLGLK